METLEAFPDGEWDFSRMFSTQDQLDIARELLGQCSFPLENDGGLQFTTLSAFSPNHEAIVNMSEVNESLFYSWNTLNNDLNLLSQENSSSSNCSSSVLIPSSCHETYFSDTNRILATNDDSMSMDFCIMDEKNSGSFVPMFPEIGMTETICMNENMSSAKMGNLDDSHPVANPVPARGLQLKRMLDFPESEVNPPENKKSRATRDMQKSKKNVKSKKNQKFIPSSNEEKERNAGLDGQSSSSCSSEEDNVSHDSKASEVLNSNGKARASRGSATDPQSLYARKRRERINERLRILQNLVPNGTKVDISTMLEEAVHYVKFLQLQIKLLSSDDLWMYAPIAYNGMDIGLNQKISMLL
ncbi:hypothetical protein P3X46_002354 [Hevea brasiliensis]|uniref:BHLH domain-containing protein n=1 Tax=Hevea brasiliensis TaxID=3981 RepID=A0ABQ9N3R8_HEVBR|nr:transcription factor RSL2 [Hevea brasiliensis]KAJ9186824.1 hypothetical protein P3X46_002354 [Hevea brasiliensis]